jgi:hypothetical protein
MNLWSWEWSNKAKETEKSLHLEFWTKGSVLESREVRVICSFCHHFALLKLHMRWVLRFLTLVYVLETRKPQIWNLACKHRVLGWIYERAGINPNSHSYITCFIWLNVFITGCMEIVGENYEKSHFLQNRGLCCQTRRGTWCCLYNSPGEFLTRQGECYRSVSSYNSP